MIKQAKDRLYLNDRLSAETDIVLMIPKKVTFNALFSLQNCFNCKQFEAINGLIIVIDNFDFQSAARRGI
ncbi:hypothetical protein DZA65_00723 [Dickeya dianthicola]|uniref:Uncharacterized protein n=1 Tax=Dickeya dianthicola TaxID=204039 RepID=A0ABX9NMP6_9GAMM|nr:hypothetical protein DZA65_00723 [Dickeya dianthicola]RJL65177.1 hypothetical protein D5072_16875 [Dickeya dianthicola]RJL72206.1 hypothetical protein D5077_11250 [Dickeya dianthicola]